MTKKRLLVIDDEPEFGVMVGTVGERLGYDVTVTTLAMDFHAGFAKDRPEIVVLDIVMPEMDGIELIQWLIDQAYDGRLIVVSGFSPDYVNPDSPDGLPV